MKYARPTLETLEGRLCPADFAWTGAAGFNWHAPENWEVGGVVAGRAPGAEDHVTIWKTAHQPLVYAADVTVGGLKLMGKASVLRLQKNLTIDDTHEVGDTYLGGAVHFEGAVTLSLKNQGPDDEFYLGGLLHTPEGYRGQAQAVAVDNAEVFTADALTFSFVDTLKLGGSAAADFNVYVGGGDVNVAGSPLLVDLYDAQVNFDARSPASGGGNWLLADPGALGSKFRLNRDAAGLTFAGGSSAANVVDLSVEAVKGVVTFMGGAWAEFSSPAEAAVDARDAEVAFHGGAEVWLSGGGSLRLRAGASLTFYPGGPDAHAWLHGELWLDGGKAGSFPLSGTPRSTFHVDSLTVDGGELFFRLWPGVSVSDRLAVAGDVTVVNPGKVLASWFGPADDTPGDQNSYPLITYGGDWHGPAGGHAFEVSTAPGSWAPDWRIDHDETEGTYRLKIL